MYYHRCACKAEWCYVCGALWDDCKCPHRHDYEDEDFENLLIQHGPGIENPNGQGNLEPRGMYEQPAPNRPPPFVLVWDGYGRPHWVPPFQPLPAWHAYGQPAPIPPPQPMPAWNGAVYPAPAPVQAPAPAAAAPWARMICPFRDHRFEVRVRSEDGGACRRCYLVVLDWVYYCVVCGHMLCPRCLLENQERQPRLNQRRQP